MAMLRDEAEAVFEFLHYLEFKNISFREIDAYKIATYIRTAMMHKRSQNYYS